MSAPKAGRQSPEPETQTDAQQGHAGQSGSGKLDNSKNQDEGKSAEDQLSGLESNPKHILEDAAKEKTSKTER